MHSVAQQNVTRKPIRPNEVENDASARPPTYLWPLIPWTYCANWHQNHLFVFKILLTKERMDGCMDGRTTWEHYASACQSRLWMHEKWETYTTQQSCYNAVVFGLEIRICEVWQNLSNDEEVFTRIPLSHNLLTIIKLDRFQRISDRQTLPFVEAFCQHSQLTIYTVSQKSYTTWCLIITLTNVDRFSKFFHQLIC